MVAGLLAGTGLVSEAWGTEFPLHGDHVDPDLQSLGSGLCQLLKRFCSCMHRLQRIWGDKCSSDGMFVGGGGSLWAKTLGCSRRSVISAVWYLSTR